MKSHPHPMHRPRRLFPLILLLLSPPLSWSAESIPPVTPEVRAAAERGEAAAQFQLARAYLHGTGVLKDVKKAFALMKSAADQGHPDAMGGLGYFYASGIAVPRDDKLALEWLRKGAEKGSAKAQLNLAKTMLSAKPAAPAKADSQKQADQKEEEALAWMKKAADQGLPEAAMSYGSALYFGDHGLAVDYAKALPYMKTAAEAGDAVARNIMGVMYQFGKGLAVDKAAAEHWYRLAALQGNLKAQSNLGYLLNPENKDKEIRTEAMAWIMLAADKDEITAKKFKVDYLPGFKGADLAAVNQRMEELAKQVQQNQRPHRLGPNAL